MHIFHVATPRLSTEDVIQKCHIPVCRLFYVQFLFVPSVLHYFFSQNLLFIPGRCVFTTTFITTYTLFLYSWFTRRTDWYTSRSILYICGILYQVTKEWTKTDLSKYPQRALRFGCSLVGSFFWPSPFWPLADYFWFFC